MSIFDKAYDFTGGGPLDGGCLVLPGHQAHRVVEYQNPGPPGSKPAPIRGVEYVYLLRRMEDGSKVYVYEGASEIL